MPPRCFSDSPKTSKITPNAHFLRHRYTSDFHFDADASEAKRSEAVLIQMPLDAPQMLIRFLLPCGSERSEAERGRSNLNTPRCLPDVLHILTWAFSSTGSYVCSRCQTCLYMLLSFSNMKCASRSFAKTGSSFTCF